MSEAQVRALRDQVFGKPIHDQGWESCRDNWMKPANIVWLVEKSARPLPDRSAKEAA